LRVTLLASPPLGSSAISPCPGASDARSKSGNEITFFLSLRKNNAGYNVCLGFGRLPAELGPETPRVGLNKWCRTRPTSEPETNSKAALACEVDDFRRGFAGPGNVCDLSVPGTRVYPGFGSHLVKRSAMRLQGRLLSPSAKLRPQELAPGPPASHKT
jgi:hypothetical protein